MPGGDRNGHRDDDEPAVVDRNLHRRREVDEDGQQPAGEAEHRREQRAHRAAGPAREAGAPPHAGDDAGERERRDQRQADHHGGGEPGDRRVAAARLEVDGPLAVQRLVDAAAVEEPRDQPRARRRLVAPEVGRVPELGEHDLPPVAQVRQQLPRRVHRRRRAVEVSADQQRLGVRVADAAVRVVVGVRRPRVYQVAAGEQDLRAGVAEDRPAVAAGLEVPPCGAGVGPRDRGDVAQTCPSGKNRFVVTDSSHMPPASPSAADSHVSIVFGAHECVRGDTSAAGLICVRTR